MQRRMSHDGHKEVSAADTHRSPKDGRGWGWGVQCVDPPRPRPVAPELAG
jgi:hypothetical protein